MKGWAQDSEFAGYSHRSEGLTHTQVWQTPDLGSCGSGLPRCVGLGNPLLSSWPRPIKCILSELIYTINMLNVQLGGRGELRMDIG